MAEFQPFNLGQVFATAEGIKAARAQATTDRLREKYLGLQIQGAQDEQARAKRQEQTVIGREKAQQIDTKAAQILAQPDGSVKNYVEQFEPDLVKNLANAGVDWATVDDNGVRQMVTHMRNRAQQELGVPPIEQQQVSGATVLTQGGKYMGSLQPRASRDDTPNSYDEFTRAQKDPAFAQFLRERRGQGLSVTLPDGTTISEGGSQPFALPKPAQNQVGEQYTNAVAGMSRLKGIVSTVKPEYLTYAGQAKGAWQKFKSKAPEVFGKLQPQEQEYLRGYQTWRSNTLDNLNLYIKEITGAAMAIPEAERIKATIPNEDDDPVSFQSKLDATMKRLSLVAARSAYLLANPAQSMGDIPLERMQLIVADRANALYTGYLQQGLDERGARQKALQEAARQFGLADAAAN